MNSAQEKPRNMIAASDEGGGVDRWIVILGSTIPVAIVLGVVIFEFFISLTGLIWLISKMRYRWTFSHVTHHSLFWPVIAWFAVVMASRCINGGTVFQFAHDAAFFRYPLFLMAMMDLSHRLPVHRYLLKGLIIGIVYAGLNVLSAHLIGYDFIGNPLSRYVFKLKEGARIGGFCTYAAPMLLLWAVLDVKLSRRHRLWVIVLGVVAALLLVLSRVRTASLAAMIGLLCGFLAQFIIQRRLKVGTLLIMVVLVGMVGWGVIWVQPSMESIYDRVFFWKVSWQVWLGHPFAGVGISSFNDAYRFIAESGIVEPFVSPATGVAYQDVTTRHAHNLILQLLVCNGVLGLGVFGWLYVQVVLTVRRFTDSWQTGLMTWPFIFLAVGITGWNIYDPFYTTIVFYFLSMISVSEKQNINVQF